MIVGNYWYFIIKFDSNGNMMWSDTNTNGDDVRGYDISIDQYQNIFVVGPFIGMVKLIKYKNQSIHFHNFIEI